MMNGEQGTFSASGNKSSDQGEKRKRLVKNVWAHNQSEIVEINFQCVIDNFCFQLQEMGEKISSPDFSAGNDDKLKWRLELYPNGNRHSKGHIAVNLVGIKSTDGSPPVVVQTDIILLNAQQVILKSYHSPLKKLNGQEDNWGSLTLKRESVVDEGRLLPSNQLHIHCKVEYEVKKTTITGSIPQISQLSSTAGNLSQRFGHFMFNENQPFSDVQIRVGGTTFGAHKFVLAAGSPVLQIMFQSEGFTENSTNIVQIDDLDPQVVHEMLHFLYTDQVPKMDELAKELLVAADKYMIDLLKFKCQVALSQTMAIDNCCELLALADSYSASELMEVAMEFLLFHAAEVAKTEGWQFMKLNQPQLCFKVSDVLMARTCKTEELSEPAVASAEPLVSLHTALELWERWHQRCQNLP